MRSLYLTFISVVLLISSCHHSEFHKAHYSNRLKNKPAHQISQEKAVVNDKHQIENSNSDESAPLTNDYVQPQFSIETPTQSEQNLAHDSINSEFGSTNIIESEVEENQYNWSTKSISLESMCPEITDLACQYLGKGTYKLTWSVPKIPIYTENGTLSEYRITRRSLEDSKAYVYKTPEPNCIDGTCSIIFENLDDSFGYTWSVDTRCTRTTFTTSNKVECKRSEPLNSRINETNNNNSLEFKSENDDNAKRTFNKKSVLAFLMVWIMLVAGIIAVITIFIGIPLLTGLLILGIIIGCIWTISTAIQGSKEISNNRKNQKGTALSVLAILGSILGLILTGLLAFVLFPF